ncbi:hypothetical protein AB1K54_05175 [Microbacterium sp. BWT-B31]|uniref:hypothetical protein n=1 Tax=Microbacterium sp. BWT-B31 TaxID=3232072 RepID=UPI0035279329
MNPPVRIPSSAAVSAAADTLASTIDALDDTVLEVTGTWSGLGSVYSAPEAEIAYQAMAPLSPAQTDLTTDLSTAVAALRTFAEALTALEVRRAELVSDIALATAAWPPSPTTPTVSEVTAQLARFAADAATVDADCARALRALRDSASWLLTGAVAPFTGNVGSGVQGLAAELLQRYRGTLLVPGPGAVLPDSISLPASAINPTWPRNVVNGQTWVQRPSGIWVLESNLLPDGQPPAGTLPGWQARPQFTPAPEIGTPPAWARFGGRALTVAGAGLTYWSVYGESYNDTLTRHPDWTDEQRQQEALVDSAVVGTSSVAAGAGGA